MKRILIAEDEKHIRQGLKTMALRSDVPIEEIIEARNGEEAWEILKEQKTDLLITDIRMPKLDGIALVERLKELPDPPLVLVVSGYDDFSYAVSMMRNGVQEYLLKPVERKQFYDALAKLEQQVCRRASLDQDRQEQTDHAFRFLMLASSDSHECQRFLQQYREIFYPGAYIGCCATEDSVPRGREKLRIRGEDELYLYIFSAQEVVSWPAVSGRSRVYEGLENLQSCYREALWAWRMAYFGTNACIYEEREIKPLIISTEQLMSWLSLSRHTEIDRALRSQAKMVARGNASPEAFAELCEQFIGRIMETYVNLVDPADSPERFLKVWNFETGERYLEELGRWLEKFSNRISQEFADYENKQKIREAVRYVQEHFCEPLSMTIVSNQVSMNYSLFSHLFKQYTGTNFVSYIQELRVNEAKRLLETTDDRVVELCYKVGFQDDKHFLKVFKASTGLSPTEYRRAHLRMNNGSEK